MTALDLFPTVDEQAERNIAGVRVFARLHGLLFEGDAYAWSVFSPCRTYRCLTSASADSSALHLPTSTATPNATLPPDFQSNTQHQKEAKT